MSKTALMLLGDKLRERGVSYSVESKMDQDYTQVTELRLEDGKFVHVHTWLFDYRGVTLLDDGLL